MSVLDAAKISEKRRRKTTGFSLFCANGGCMKDVRTTNPSATLRNYDHEEKEVTFCWFVCPTEGGLTLLQYGR
ncbi:hypothetical protein ILUMI_17509 [Ignelater luminosus]|uniref:Uncharacterized protein n=1 Tax=Ignelater luminosus TaxID=2038154 RepID=A0A8K0CLK5_IGNLU|nr:hypothetical protein ILUMI_17509 [Ignelater luminosus]